jgi:signal transduction histidine kinase/CheY-like chemotaxis protein
MANAYDQQNVKFPSDLRVPALLVIWVCLFLGLILGFWVQIIGNPGLLPFSLMLYAVAFVSWCLNRFRGWASRWFLVVSAVGIILLVRGRLTASAPLILASIPVALAAALISLRAAALVAVIQTALLFYPQVPPNTGESSIALVSVWITFGLMVALYQPMYRQSRWSWEHYDLARGMLDEARDSRAELAQALEDLSDANAQLTRLNRLAHGLRNAAEAARQAKEEFAANVSHELRTPLNMIVGFSEMILQSPDTYGKIPSSLLADLAVIERNGQHLSSLVDDVLELSQIDAGRVALVKELVMLSEILDAALEAVRPMYEAKHLSLEIVGPRSVTLSCDRLRIRQVLLNLLINAGRFTEQGGAQVRVSEDVSHVTVSVADTGPGIAKEDQSRLFEPFEQLGGTTAQRQGGSGLGLSISRDFVELHGGRMWIDSDLGQGATFSFRLPKNEPVPLESGAARWLEPTWEYTQRTQPLVVNKGLMRRRIIVLDTSGSLAKLLSRHLVGAEVVLVASSEEVEREISRLPAQAVLINVNSADEGLAERVSLGLPLETPVMVCSIPGALEAASELDASHYLTKPVTRKALLDALDRACPGGRTVLVVDDEMDAQRLFRKMLVSSGRPYRVLRATGGRQAIEAMQSQRPDVVLLDLVMSDMDGFAVLKEMRAASALSGIPVVVASALDPGGHPIATQGIAVARKGGLSARELLRVIESLSDILSPEGRADDLAPTAILAG